jgi:hypothetical protein
MCLILPCPAKTTRCSHHLSGTYETCPGHLFRGTLRRRPTRSYAISCQTSEFAYALVFRSGDPGSEPNSITITAPDMFSDFFWLEQYPSPFDYPSFYAAGTSSSQATDSPPVHLMQRQQ